MCLWKNNRQKQPPEVFCQKKVFLKISQYSQGNTCVASTLFSVGTQSARRKFGLGCFNNKPVLRLRKQPSEVFNKKNCFLKISQYSQENTCVFLINFFWQVFEKQLKSNFSNDVIVVWLQDGRKPYLHWNTPRFPEQCKFSWPIKTNVTCFKEISWSGN